MPENLEINDITNDIKKDSMETQCGNTGKEKMTYWKTACGKKFNKGQQYSGHITSCDICKDFIKNEKLNWNKKCKCGCNIITKYNLEFASKKCYYNWKHNDKKLSAKISNTVKNNYKTDPSIIKRISESVKNAWKNENIRKKYKIARPRLVDKTRKTKNDKEFRQLCSTNSKKRWNDPIFRNLQIKKIKQSFTPETSIKRSNSLKITWNNRTKEQKQKIGQKISNTKAELISSGKLNIKSKYYHHGYYKNEYYNSSYEFNRMKYYDDNNINWTKKHKIKINYIDVNGNKRYYIPDFKIFIDDKIIIEEIKGFIKENDIEKSLAAINFCKNLKWSYRFLLGKNLILQPNLSYDQNN